MSPVNIDVFLEDKTVQSVIDNSLNPGLVIIDTANSDKGLKAGNRKITGITAGKYYKIEEIEDGKVVGTPYFVKANGSLSDELKDIRKINNGITAITGLNNDVMYRVKSATAYTGGTIQFFKLNDVSPKSATVSGGEVTISESRSPCYFTVSTTIGVENFYEVINVGKWDDGARTSAKRLNSGSVGNSLSNTDKTNYEYHDPARPKIGIFQYRSGVNVTPDILNGKSIMELPAVSTVNDYVFVQDLPDGSTKDFYYLTVTVDSSEGKGNIQITPPTIPANEEITLTYGSNTSIVEGAKIQISLGDPTAANKTITASGGSNGTYNWYYNNTTTSISSSNNIVIGNTAPLNVAGTYSIIVEKTVTTGGVSVVYSKWFVLEIKP